MMQAMGLKSPAPIQSRLKHLQQKGFISWQEGKARTLQIVDDVLGGVPVMGSVAAGGLIETFSDVSEELDISEVLKKKDIFALTVNGDSMIDAGIHDEDIVVVDKNIEPKNGDIGAFMINDTEATVKFLDTISGKKYLIPANKNYENFEVNENIQPIGKVVSLFRDI